MDKTDRQMLLEKELIEEKRRLKKDEIILKGMIVITTAILLILIVSTVFIYFELQNQSQASANSSFDEVSEITPEVTQKPERIMSDSPIQYQEPVITASSFKEQFISFGSGISSSTDWTDVKGLKTTVDLSGYGDIKEIRFEASVQDPAENQIVWVRLYNLTDKHPVWNSEVSKSAGAEGYLVSDPIIYDTGNKNYSIQMKTQLGSTVSLGEARVHIILE